MSQNQNLSLNAVRPIERKLEEFARYDLTPQLSVREQPGASR